MAETIDKLTDAIIPFRVTHEQETVGGESPMQARFAR
jgi:hypothetical protein